MSQRSTSLDWLCLLAFGLTTSAACVIAARQIGVTFDEPTYLDHGLNFWHTGSHRQLMKLGTMPLPVDVQTFPVALVEWYRGDRFDFQHDFSRMIVWMRHGNLIFWWLLLYFGMQLGRDLGGPWAGRIAVAALACEPNLLAHAALATTDIAITAALLAFVVAFRRGRDGDRRQRMVWPGIWCGIALLSKASALAFCPLLMAAVEIVRRINVPSQLDWRQQLTTFLRDGMGIATIGFVIAFVGCGSDFLPNEWFVYWSNNLSDGAIRTGCMWLADHLCIFGNAGEALANQVHHNLRGHGQFLFGASNQQPFWYYFPALFMMKMTIPILAAAAFGLLWRPGELLRNPALAAFAVLLVFSLNCRVQLGIRLQFPAVAMLVVGLSVAVVAACPAVPWRRWAASFTIATGLSGMALASAMSFPNGLCYANCLWGGPQRVELLVSDSNYDWGQGLRELDAWHERQGRPGLDVWYFGKDPALKAMPVRDLPLHCVPLTCAADLHQYLWGRKLAVSISVLHGWQMTPAHRVALDFLARRHPIDRTQMFLIYDFSDISQPTAVATGLPNE
jgi:hypothetical protein